MIRNRIGPLISVVEYFFPTAITALKQRRLVKGNGRGFDPRRGFTALLPHALADAKVRERDGMVGDGWRVGEGSTAVVEVGRIRWLCTEHVAC